MPMLKAMVLISVNSWVSTILTFQRRREGNWTRLVAKEESKQIGGRWKDLIVDILVSSEYMLKIEGK